MHALCASCTCQGSPLHRLRRGAATCRPSCSRSTFGRTSSTAARREVAELERPVGDPDQPVDRQPDRLQRPADLAVAALAERHRQPDVRALLPVDRRPASAGSARPSTVMPAAQRLERRVVRRPVRPHPVLAQPAGRGQLQPPLQRPVVGEEQQPLGVEVEPPDATRRAASPPAGARRPCRAPSRRAPRSRAPAACGSARAASAPASASGLPSTRDPVGGGDVQRRAVDHPPVHRHPPGGDHRLGDPARGDAGPRQPLGDPLRRRPSSRHAAAPSRAAPGRRNAKRLAARGAGARRGHARFAPHMEAALAEARAAFARAETPVGAVIVDPPPAG